MPRTKSAPTRRCRTTCNSNDISSRPETHPLPVDNNSASVGERCSGHEDYARKRTGASDGETSSTKRVAPLADSTSLRNVKDSLVTEGRPHENFAPVLEEKARGSKHSKTLLPENQPYKTQSDTLSNKQALDKQSKMAVGGEPNVERSKASSRGKKLSGKTSRRKKSVIMPKRKTPSKTALKNQCQRRQSTTASEEGPKDKRSGAMQKKQPLGTQSKIVPEKPHGQQHKTHLEEETAMKGSPSHKQSINLVKEDCHTVSKQSNAASKEAITMEDHKQSQSSLNGRRHSKRLKPVPKGAPQSKKSKIASDSDDLSDATAKRQFGSTQSEGRESGNEQPMAVSDKELCSKHLKTRSKSQLDGTCSMSRIVLKVEPGCQQSVTQLTSVCCSEQPNVLEENKLGKQVDTVLHEEICGDQVEALQEEEAHTRWSKAKSRKNGPCNHPLDMSDSESDVQELGSVPRERRCSKRSKSTSKEGLHSKEPSNTLEEKSHSNKRSRTVPREQSSSKRSKTLLKEEPHGEQAETMTDKKPLSKKKKAVLAENPCNLETEVKRNTRKRRPCPVKEARVQKSKTKGADRERIAGKARVTEWQIASRMAAQWQPISSGAAKLVLDIMESSTG